MELLSSSTSETPSPSIVSSRVFPALSDSLCALTFSAQCSTSSVFRAYSRSLGSIAVVLLPVPLPLVDIAVVALPPPLSDFRAESVLGVFRW